MNEVTDVKLTLGSLFDGAGGFPPIWASEIEPFCVRVTSKRFPQMKHLGNITKINGADIDPVGVITFGSPCQDLSVAKGSRKGLDGERSGLFREAIRIIKEMRGAANERNPTSIIWENVPGAFSASRGAGFRTALEEITKIKYPGSTISLSEKWENAGAIVVGKIQFECESLLGNLSQGGNPRQKITRSARNGTEKSSGIDHLTSRDVQSR